MCQMHRVRDSDMFVIFLIQWPDPRVIDVDPVAVFVIFVEDGRVVSDPAHLHGDVKREFLSHGYSSARYKRLSL